MQNPVLFVTLQRVLHERDTTSQYKENFMDNRKDITEVIPAWANTWAREKNTTLEWVEYATAAVNARYKWAMLKSHVTKQNSGLNLQLTTAPIAVVPESTSEADVKADAKDAKPIEPAKPDVFPCMPGETIIAAARRIQSNSQIEDSFTLSGSVVLSCASKVDLKKDGKPDAHKKWVISIQDVLADLQRWAALQDEALVSNADKAAFQEALNGLNIADGKISFVLAPAENKVAETKEAKVAPVKTNAGILSVLGFGGSQGKGVPSTVDGAAQEKDLNSSVANASGMK